MRIALLGYGKMGKEIEKIALSRGHQISLKVGSDNSHFSQEALSDSDVAIEFSTPATAVHNISTCFKGKVPVIVGTTGWYEEFESICAQCEQQQGGLFYATNFSIGVNIFFEINKKLAQLMNHQPGYSASMSETHHIHKLDAPSGTAITLAEQMIAELDNKSAWHLGTHEENSSLPIDAIRLNEVPGTHSISYESDVDRLEITHAANSRKGFALGAVLAAEWMPEKQGVFTMQDLLQF